MDGTSPAGISGTGYSTTQHPAEGFNVIYHAETDPSISPVHKMIRVHMRRGCAEMTRCLQS